MSGNRSLEASTALDVAREALILALMISAPLLMVGLVVGVLISILQAVTQVQEMTLTFVPKIVAMVFAGIIFLPYILQKLMNYAIEMFGPMVVP